MRGCSLSSPNSALEILTLCPKVRRQSCTHHYTIESADARAAPVHGLAPTEGVIDLETGGSILAGYSGTPLPQKLGIRGESRVALLGAPEALDRTLSKAVDTTVWRDLRGKGSFDVILFFATSQSHLRARFGTLARRLVSNGGLWIAWPKKASGVETDLDEGGVRNIGLQGGLVDNKVCAIDDTWSGLRFVIRLQDRPRPTRRASA